MKNDRPEPTLTRREFGVRAGLAAAGLAAGRPETSRAEQGGKTSRRPNIIFLLTDDHRWDAMGCAGNTIIQTPNMDRMARDGVMFENAFVTTSICMASRASILTGQYERRHGCTFGTPPLSGEAMRQTYPALLGKAGYRTGFIGKFGVSTAEPKQWFDYWKGFRGQGRYEQTDDKGVYKHLTSIMGDQAVEFLGGCKQDQPFCLSISFKAPHCQDGDPRQFVHDVAYGDLYKDVQIPVPKTATPRHFQAMPECVRKSEARDRWRIRFATPEMHQRSVKGYYRLITGVDRVIGRIMRELASRKLDDNTILLLIGDNGFYLGEHGLAGKWYAHEESIRVPLLLYDPRLPKPKRGNTIKEMAQNIDIAPTILDLAGLPVPTRAQGRSLLPLVRGESANWREDIFYEHLFERHNIPKSEGLRTNRWKYLRYFEQKPVHEEVYDLENDPLEERNLAGDPLHQAIVRSLRKRCDELRDAAK